MKLTVSGRNIDISPAFKTHASDRLKSAADKYFERLTGASVTVSKEGHMYHVQCNLQGPGGVNMQAQADAPEAYASLDLAAEKLEKQLRRYKRRIKNHHESARGADEF